MTETCKCKKMCNVYIYYRYLINETFYLCKYDHVTFNSYKN